MNLKPLADRVVVKPSAAEEKTKGGIIVPDTAKEKPVWGTVIAVTSVAFLGRSASCLPCFQSTTTESRLKRKNHGSTRIESVLVPYP